MIRYLLLVYILGKRILKGPIGPLFRELSDENLLLSMAERFWAFIKELIIKSSHLICYKIEPDILFHILDLIEDSIIKPVNLSTAKL